MCLSVLIVIYYVLLHWMRWPPNQYHSHIRSISIVYVLISDAHYYQPLRYHIHQIRLLIHQPDQQHRFRACMPENR